MSKGNAVFLAFQGEGILCYLEILGLEIPGVFFTKSLSSGALREKKALEI